jgi:uncharacterized lipoprotein YehR (DUF1307 family)
MATRHATIALVLTLVVALALAGCGQSKEDKAFASVCDARADINKQVDHLRSLTPATATLNDVQKSFTAITSDLGKIADAQGDLNGARKQQIQNANQQFKSQLSNIVSTVGRSLSARDAKQQAQQALQQLATVYQQTLAPIDCS